MKIPNWFIVGCGLLVLNVALVLGGIVSRHAFAESPDDSKSTTVTDNDTSAAPPATTNMPQFPSLESTAPAAASVLKLDDFKEVFSASLSDDELTAPLAELAKEPQIAVPEQLSHSFFDSMKLRLKTTEHLNQSALGLVEEAAMLFQRGDIKSAQELLRTATTLREMTAKLLVTRQ